MERILIVRLGAMGDIIHGLPAVAALRHQFPQAHIGWVVESRWSDLLQAEGAAENVPLSPARPLVDVVHRVQTRAWRSSALTAHTRNDVLKAFREVRGQKYDAALDLQGAIKSAVITGFSGAKRKTGPSSPREAPAKWFYDLKVASTAKHVIQQYADIAATLAGAIQIPQDAQPHLLPVAPSAENWCERELQERGLEERKFAILSPGAGWKAKQWPAARYGEVARELRKRGVASVVNIGPSEAGLASEVEAASGGMAKAIRCDVAQLISLTRRAKLFIGGDTGPMHLANLLGIPVVALFGPTDPERNGPFFQPSVLLRGPGSKTSYSHRNQLDEGLLSISVEQVVAAATDLAGRS